MISKNNTSTGTFVYIAGPRGKIRNKNCTGYWLHEFKKS